MRRKWRSPRNGPQSSRATIRRSATSISGGLPRNSWTRMFFGPTRSASLARPAAADSRADPDRVSRLHRIRRHEESRHGEPALQIRLELHHALFRPKRRRPLPKILRSERAAPWRQRRSLLRQTTNWCFTLSPKSRANPAPRRTSFESFLNAALRRWRRTPRSISNGRTSFTARRSNVWTCSRASSSACSARSAGYRRSTAPMSSWKGRQQKKPNSFMEMNQRACEFFERAYGSLEARTKKKIQFTETLVCNYSQDVLPMIKDKPKFKGSSKSGRATTLNFLVSVFQKQTRWNRSQGRHAVTRLEVSRSVPSSGKKRRTSMRSAAITRSAGLPWSSAWLNTKLSAEKGLPVSLSLENVEGFADVARGGGRGAFIPAQDRIKSLADPVEGERSIMPLPCIGFRRIRLRNSLRTLPRSNPSMAKPCSLFAKARSRPKRFPMSQPRTEPSCSTSTN